MLAMIYVPGAFKVSASPQISKKRMSCHLLNIASVYTDKVSRLEEVVIIREGNIYVTMDIVSK